MTDRDSARHLEPVWFQALLGSIAAAWCLAVADTAVLFSNANASGMLRFVARAGLATFNYSTIVGLGYGVLALLIAKRHRLGPRWLLLFASPALLLAVLWIFVAIGLGKGPGISGSKWHLPVVVGLSLAGSAGLFACQWLYDRVQRQSSTRVSRGVAACFLVLACIAYGSGFLYPNSYHLAHAYMLVLALVGVHAAYLLVCKQMLHDKRRQIAVALAAMGFVVLGFALPLDHTSRFLAFRDAQLVRQVMFHRVRIQQHDAANRIVRYDFAVDHEYGTRPLAPCSEHGGNNYDVILISVDSLRADRLAVSQPQRQVVPNIDALAERSLVYPSAYSPSPSTSTSLVPLISGSSALALRESGEVSSTLATEFGRLGYETISYQPFGSVAQRVFTGTSPKKLGFTVTAKAKNADEFANGVIAKIEENPEQPFFIYHHLLEPHLTYSKHAGFDFGDSMVDKYDSEVAYVDHHIGRIIDAVANAGRSDRTIIAITADHAEAFYEHGLMAHGTSLYDEMVRVPLIVAGPTIAPQIRTERVSLVDVAPTLLALNGCGWSMPQEGRPLWANGVLQSPTRPVLVIQYNEHDKGASFVRRIATFDGEMKLIEDLQTGSVELYSLVDDPGETRNLASQHPGKLRHAREQRYEGGRRLGWFAQESLKAADTPLATALRTGGEDALEAAYSRIVDQPKSREAAHLVRILGEVKDEAATNKLRQLVSMKKLPATLQRLAARSLSKRDRMPGESLLSIAISEEVAEHARAEALLIVTESTKPPSEDALRELTGNKSDLVAGVAVVALCDRVGAAKTSEGIRSRFASPESLKKLPVETVRTLIGCVGKEPTDDDIAYLLAIYATSVAKEKHSVYLIIKALGRASSDLPVAPLSEMALSNWEPIRVEAIKSIIELGSANAAAALAKLAATKQSSEVEPEKTRAMLRRHTTKHVVLTDGMPVAMNWLRAPASEQSELVFEALQEFSPGHRLVVFNLRKSPQSSGVGQCSIFLGPLRVTIDIASLSASENRAVYWDPDAQKMPAHVGQVHVKCQDTSADQAMDLASVELLQMIAPD